MTTVTLPILYKEFDLTTEIAEEHEVEGQEDYLLGGFSNPPKSYLRKLRALRG